MSIPRTLDEVVDLLFPSRHYYDPAAVGHGGAACGEPIRDVMDERHVSTNRFGVTCVPCLRMMHSLGISGYDETY